MNISVKFIWFDMWVGLFIDIKKRCVYVAPLPCVIFIFQWGVHYYAKVSKARGYKVTYVFPNLSWFGKLCKKIWGHSK